tara:strand:- start:659 stop:925 length:267 start_codon:yes stop_codon:yes gene_type:complete
MKEYWNKPQKNIDSLVAVDHGKGGGWFRTGDIAEIDEDGTFFEKCLFQSFEKSYYIICVHYSFIHSFTIILSLFFKVLRNLLYHLCAL